MNNSTKKQSKPLAACYSPGEIMQETILHNKDNTEGNLLFPVFLKIDQLNILIVGGGNVGLEKLQGLLKNNARAKIVLVAPAIKEDIRTLAERSGSVRLINREFRAGDLDGVNIAILATENRETNQKILAMAKARNILTNVADTPDLCDFYLGSTVKKGNLKIGISTNGLSPTFSKRFRELLEESLPDDVDALLQNLRRFRDQLRGDFGNKVRQLNQLTAGLIKKGTGT